MKTLFLLLVLAACAPAIAPCGPSDQPISAACIACLGGGSMAACLDPAAAR